MRKKESGEHAGNRLGECMGNRLGECMDNRSGEYAVARESKRNARIKSYESAGVEMVET